MANDAFEFGELLIVEPEAPSVGVDRRPRYERTGPRAARVEFVKRAPREAVVFSEALIAARSLLEPGTVVLLDVEAEADGETVRARVQSIVSLDQAADARSPGIDQQR